MAAVQPTGSSSGGTTWQPYPSTPVGPGDELDQAKKSKGLPVGAKPTAPPSNNNPFANMTPQQIAAYIQAQAAQLAASGGSGGSGTSAADLAEKRREFDVTTQRDISKENAAEVTALQKMLQGQSGPKDVYADLFFSHGLMPPQGYKPAPVPLTQAQKDAYSKMGVNPQDLQAMLTGTGQPGADTGMLGNLGQSLQAPPGLPQSQPVQPGQIQQMGPSNPTVQGGQLFGKAPAGVTATDMQPPMTPGGVPSMAAGGMVPDTDQEQPQGAGPSNGGLKSMLPPGLHPAIAQLVDAVSNLLSNPDFRPFVEDSAPPHEGGAPVLAMLHGGEEVTPADEVGERPERPGAPQTPGGVQSMATGGSVTGGLTPEQNLSYQQTGLNPTLSPTPPVQPSPAVGQATPISTTPIGGMTPPQSNPGGSTGRPNIIPASGAPTAGAQGVISNSGGAQAADNPVMPLSKMDPYTKALYDVHGRLHPYSAQQESEMGPQGQGAVQSYISKVLGGDYNAYKDLIDRLRPQGAPTASAADVGGGFKWG